MKLLVGPSILDIFLLEKIIRDYMEQEKLNVQEIDDSPIHIKNIQKIYDRLIKKIKKDIN